MHFLGLRNSEKYLEFWLKLIPKSSRILVPLCSTNILLPPISVLPPITSIETIYFNPIAQLFTGTSLIISSYCASTITSLILLRTWSGLHVRSSKKFLSPYAACAVIIPIFCAGSMSLRRTSPTKIVCSGRST